MVMASPLPIHVPTIENGLSCAPTGVAVMSMARYARQTPCVMETLPLLTGGRTPSDRLARARSPARHELVRRQRIVHHFACAFRACHRQALRFEQADLHEHRRLVPVDVLVRDLVALEAHDGDQRDFDALSGRR